MDETSSGSPSAVRYDNLQAYLVIEIFFISLFRCTLHNHPCKQQSGIVIFNNDVPGWCIFCQVSGESEWKV